MPGFALPNGHDGCFCCNCDNDFNYNYEYDYHCCCSYCCDHRAAAVCELSSGVDPAFCRGKSVNSRYSCDQEEPLSITRALVDTASLVKRLGLGIADYLGRKLKKYLARAPFISQPPLSAATENTLGKRHAKWLVYPSLPRACC